MKNINNPVFESLYNSATKYQKINEESVKSERLNMEELQEYLTLVQNELVGTIIRFSQIFPFEKTRQELVKILIDEFEKLGKSSRVQDLIDSLNKIWETIESKVSSSEVSSVIKKEYNTVSEGVNKLIESFEQIKKEAGSKIDEKSIIDLVNNNILLVTKEFKETLSKIKTTTASAKK